MRLTDKLLLIVLGAGLGCVAPVRAAEIAAPLRMAQLFNSPQPPADLDDDQPQGRGGQDAGALVVRIDRLENQIRTLTGQIEQLQFQVRRLEEQARPPAAQTGVGAPAGAAAVPPLGAPVNLGDPSRQRRGDAFDPTQAPNAPGAPRPIGTTAGSATVAAVTPSGPLARTQVSPPPMQPMDLGQPRLAPPAVETTPGGTIIANAQPPGPKEEYELAASFLKQGQYDSAEKSFSAFIAKNAKNRYVPDAIYGLGESYFQRGRNREAAEQYLKITTSYPNSAKGAEALLRLGESLNALGAKEQACASFSEIGRKYPNASTVRAAADREAKKISC